VQEIICGSGSRLSDGVVPYCGQVTVVSELYCIKKNHKEVSGQEKYIYIYILCTEVLFLTKKKRPRLKNINFLSIFKIAKIHIKLSPYMETVIESQFEFKYFSTAILTKIVPDFEF
jgi:hypothetical protein